MSKSHSNPSNGPSLIVTSDAVQRQSGKRVANNWPKRLAIIVGVLVLCSGTYLYLRPEVNDTATSSEKRAPTMEQMQTNSLRNLEATEPSKDAPATKRAAYYDKLVAAYAGIKDYKKAVVAFETRAAITKVGLTYQDYAYAGLYYHNLGKDAEARKAFDTAVEVTPKSGDPETGYSYQTIMKQIAASRQELGL